jgi:hypothetical protein
MSIHIKNVNAHFEREPLIRPFGFKGGYLSNLWNTIAYMESDDGTYGFGLGTQSVLWCDKNVFLSSSEGGGNALMFAITDYALQMVKGQKFDNPIQLQEEIFDELYKYAKKITGFDSLSKTFVLNALVSFDNAAWMLYARKNGFGDFDNMVPESYRKALSHRHNTVASIPIASYGMPFEEIEKVVSEQGAKILKFKLGSPGSQEEMLEQDKKAIEKVHKAVGDTHVEYTEDGKFPYYLDLNGRYEAKDTVKQLLDHADKIGAIGQIKILEEPFPETSRENVSDLGVNVAADESAHTSANVMERIELGYGSIALKAIAKTLSTTLKMAETARQNNVPCFAADLTVNPILVDWNKNVAARLAPIPGFKIGLMETNGHQNYMNWAQMQSYHPYPDASWTKEKEGVFKLGDDFFNKSGGILEDSDHYVSLVKK